MRQSIKVNDISIYLLLALYSAVTLLFVSKDSYLYSTVNHIDSAWFFMGGKAWMNGLPPYVDYSDSKGPILWLIYGIGYLLSHYDYIGVYWLTCLFYAVTYCYTYKIFNILFADRRKSFVATILMTAAYFCWWYHGDIRAEDFCQTFITISLYRTFNTLYGGRLSDKQLRHTFTILGICFSCIFMIKFNLSAIIGIFTLFCLHSAFRAGRRLLPLVAWWAAGSCIVIVPLLIYFIYKGCLSAFLREYFLATSSTVIYKGGGILNSILPDIQRVLSNTELSIVALVTLTGAWLMHYRLKKYRWFPLAVASGTIAIATLHCYWNYYYLACSYLFIFLIYSLLSPVKRRIPLLAIATVMLAVMPITSYTWIQHCGYTTFKSANTSKTRNFAIVNKIIGETHNPRILNLFSHEYGFGMQANTLPAGRYWSYQMHSTPEMEERHKSIVEAGSADYIIFCSTKNESSKKVSSAEIEQCGYVIRHKWQMDTYQFLLYSKRKYEQSSYESHHQRHSCCLQCRKISAHLPRKHSRPDIQ